MRSILCTAFVVLVIGLVGCSLKFTGEVAIMERFNKATPIKEETSIIKKQTTTNTVETSEVTK